MGSCLFLNVEQFSQKLILRQRFPENNFPERNLMSPNQEQFYQPFQLIDIHLRNKFNFWNVHGIMNTSGLLQSK